MVTAAVDFFFGQDKNFTRTYLHAQAAALANFSLKSYFGHRLRNLL